jgi:hypothetical protein
MKGYINIKKIRFIKIILLPVLLLLAYSFFMIYSLGKYSEVLQKDYDRRKLKGKKVSDVVQFYGTPTEMDCKSSLEYNISLSYFEVSEPYCELTYYTDSTFLNNIGWFPGGGTRIFVDKNGNVSRLKSYLE